MTPDSLSDILACIDIKPDSTEHAADPLDCGAPGEYVLAMEDTPPGQEEAAESVVVALGGNSNLLRPRLLLGRIARMGE